MTIKLETETEAIEPAEAIETGEETEAPEAEQTPEQEVAAFYDATKVPEALQPSFKEMQAAWTKKNQEFTPYRDFEKSYGKLDEVKAVMDQLRDPQGVLNWWVGVAQELGVSQEKLSALFAQAQEATPVAPAGTPAAPAGAANPNDPNRPMTLAEFQGWQAAQQQAQYQAQVQSSEDAQVENALTQLKVAPEARQFVLVAAQQQPANLGYGERIRRGYEQYQSHLDGYMQSKQAAAAANASAPRGLAGAMPGAGGSPAGPRNFKDALKGAEAFLQGL